MKKQGTRNGHWPWLTCISGLAVICQTHLCVKAYGIYLNDKVKFTALAFFKTQNQLCPLHFHSLYVAIVKWVLPSPI